MSHHYSPGSDFAGEPHPSHHQQRPGQPQTLTLAGGRPLPMPAPVQPSSPAGWWFCP